MVKFHGMYPSPCPQTSPGHVISGWLHKGIFFVFIGGILVGDIYELGSFVIPLFYTHTYIHLSLT